MTHHFTDSLIESYQSLTEAYTSPYLDYTDTAKASKAFNNAYKNKLLDLTAFHQAYDKELADADMLDLFNDKGLLKHRGVYGKIKEYPKQDAYFIIAIKKLWGIQFSDRDKYSFKTVEQAEEEKKQKEAAEQERKRKEEEEKLKRQAYKDYKAKMEAKLEDIKKIVLTKVDQKLLTELKTYITEPQLQEPELEYWYYQDDFEKNNGTQAELRISFKDQSSRWNNENTPYTKYIPARRKQIIQDPLNLTETEIQAIVKDINELMSEYIKNMSDAKLLERKNLIEHRVFGERGFRSGRLYIIKDNNEYFAIKGNRDNYSVGCLNYNTKSKDIPILSDKAELYGVSATNSRSYGSEHSVYSESDYYKYMSWNSNLPKEILDDLGWANFYEDNNYHGGELIPISKDEAEDSSYFYTTPGIDKWSYEHRWYPSTD